jgi:putative tryptophan/tyrosine transport system substrate-binding protein
MKRRKLIILVCGMTAALPLAGLAQRSDRMRRVCVLLGLAESDPEGQERYTAFRERLQQLGWTEGGNVQLVARWAAGDTGRTQAYATELVKLAPDVILVNTPPGLAALQAATRSIPIVFVQVVDAREAGVSSPARPGGNVTGFYTVFEYSIAGKWLQLLKEAAPALKRVAVMQHPNHPAWKNYLDAINNVAPSLGIEVIPADVREPADIQRVIAIMGREPGGGLLVPPDSFTATHRGSLAAAAEHHRLPTIGHFTAFTTAGGLMSYGADLKDLVRQSATYVDRILRGANPSELPVQASTKFEFAINLKTAKALGLTIPQAMLLRADHVIR